MTAATEPTTEAAYDVMARLLAAREADRRGEDPRPGPREHERFLLLLTDPEISERLFGGREDVGLILLQDHLFDGGVDSVRHAAEWVSGRCGYAVEPVERAGQPFHWTFRPTEPI